MWDLSNLWNLDHVGSNLTPFQKEEVTPLEVSRGYTWKARCTVKELGKWEPPPGWKPGTVSAGFKPEDLRLIYRKGQVWQKAPSTFVNQSGVPCPVILANNIEPLVNLSVVPRAVDEVRLRGRLATWQSYQGTPPLGWRPPPNLHKSGYFWFYVVESNPVDIQIKAPDRPMPSPHISRQQKIELMEARWFSGHYRGEPRNSMYLKVRYKDKKEEPLFKATMENLRVYDASGHELSLRTRRFESTQLSPSFVLTSPDDPGTSTTRGDESILSLFSPDYELENGWESRQQPLRIEAGFSDGTCWPTKITAIFHREPEDGEKMMEFGVIPPGK